MAQERRFFQATLILVLALLLGAGLHSTPANAGVSVLGAPAWLELSPQQKAVLAPLAGEWNTMEDFRRQKWLGIAARYPSMTPQDQARITQRMQAWARLTPEQRIQARERFKKLQKAPPTQKEDLVRKWHEYQQLPAEEKKRLAEQAKARSKVQKKRHGVRPTSKFTKPVPRPQPPIGAPNLVAVPPGQAGSDATAPASAAAGYNSAPAPDLPLVTPADTTSPKPPDTAPR